MMAFEGKRIATLDDLCQAMAPVFQAMGYPAPTAVDLLDQLAKDQAAERRVLETGLRARETQRQERTLLRDERGSAYGEVKAEIPVKLYMELRGMKNFGPAALNCPEGLKEVLKAYPACRVKGTGSKYIGSGLGARGSGRKGRVKFGRGTMDWAK